MSERIWGFVVKRFIQIDAYFTLLYFVLYSCINPRSHWPVVFDAARHNSHALASFVSRFSSSLADYTLIFLADFDDQQASSIPLRLSNATNFHQFNFSENDNLP